VTVAGSRLEVGGQRWRSTSVGGKPLVVTASGTSLPRLTRERYVDGLPEILLALKLFVIGTVRYMKRVANVTRW